MTERGFLGYDWLAEIEKSIRVVVKLLRENGVNTTCSCGHEMYVQCQWQQDCEATEIFNLLWNNGYKDFVMTFHHDARPHTVRRWYEIYIKSPVTVSHSKEE